jgi:LruC domain-containing protein
MFDDYSDFLGGVSFVTLNYMPWAIEIPTVWDHPAEKVDLTKAYPNFSDYVFSEGREQQSWFTKGNAVSSKVVNNP